ncbi:PHP domain-containing protein [Metallumcola ferriviriculae]|uniref:PHP domain-containing protein n=1 Tax=Metallumcola ferriviriculae TaxID=3039180 RepID=A0AAU0UM45_9FIRM|nr:PHP domain-containing protein [Desulfitibacteraceae bacterium MK1]
MQFTADLHMHTKYSDGRGTMEQMARAGFKKGLGKIAITDHGPANIGVGVKSAEQLLEIKREAARISQEVGIRVLVGVEADIIGVDGEIDVPPSIYQQLDLLLVGLHPHVFPHDWGDGYNFILPNQIYRASSLMRDKVIGVNTQAVVAALEKHPVDILTHPGLLMPVDYLAVAKACTRTGTYFEINTGHLHEHFMTPAIIKRVCDQGVDFIVNSDSHYPETVGELEAGWAMLEQAGVTAARVANVRMN